MSENNTTNIKVGISLDNTTINKSIDQLQSSFNKMFENSNPHIEKMFSKIENEFKRVGLDYSKHQHIFDSVKSGGAFGNNKNNAKLGIEILTSEYGEKFIKLDKKISQLEIANDKEVFSEKIKDYLKGTEMMQRIRKDVDNQRKQEEKAEYKEESERRKKQQAEETAIKKRDDEVLATAQQKLKDKQKQIAKEKKEEEEHVKEQKQRMYRFFGGAGRGVGGILGGTTGAMVGQSVGENVGDMFNGRIGKGVLGIAIEALTLAIKNFTTTMVEVSETGYQASALGTTTTKLNSVKLAAKVFNMSEKDVTPAINSIGTFMAGLNFKDNGSFGSGANESSLQFAQMAARLKVPLIDSNKKPKDSVDLFFELMHSPEWKNQGFDDKTKAQILSKWFGVDYTKMPRMIDSAYENEYKRNNKINAVTARAEKVGNELIASGGRTINDDWKSGLLGGTALEDKIGEGNDITEKAFNILHHKVKSYNSAEDILMSAPVIDKQMELESSRDPNAKGSPFRMKDGHYNQAFGLFGVSRDTANSPETLAAMGRNGKPFSDTELKNPILNKKLRDWIIKDDLKNLIKSNPDLQSDPEEAAKQTLIWYNHSTEDLHKYQKTGYVNNDYADRILNTVNINIDARGNSNADEIGKKTASAVNEHTKQKRNVVMNNQPSTRI